MASTGVSVNDFGSEDQRRCWLPGIASGAVVGAHTITEEAVGSDALSMDTRARRIQEGWVVSGAKTFVTNGGVTDVYIVYARTSETPSALGLTAFLVPAQTPGLTVGRRLETMGLNAAPVTQIVLDECRIPADAVLGRVGGGFLVLDHVMQREILFSFMFNVGEMEVRLSRCVEWARNREQFGRSIGANQAISHRIAAMRIQVDTARMWLERAGRSVMAGTSATLDVAAAKVVASTANRDTALAAVQLFGGRGYLTEHGLEKAVRDALGGSIYSGTNEIQMDRIASMMGLR